MIAETLMEPVGIRFACRRCGEPVPAGPLAAEAARTGSRLALDRQCGACGHRALYSTA